MRLFGPSPITGVQWTNIPSDLIPTTDDTFDLGSATKNWQDLFLSGKITIDSESTTQYAIDINAKYGIQITQDISGGRPFNVRRNIDEAGSNALARLSNQHANNTQPTLLIDHDGTGGAAGYPFYIKSENAAAPAIKIETAYTNAIEADGGIAVTGVISGKTGIISKSAAYTLGTDDSDESYGYTVLVTSAAVITLPAVVAGMSVLVYSTTAAAVSVDPNPSDRIILNGTALTGGNKVTSASGAGDFIFLFADSANGWTTLGRSGLWTDGGA